VSIDEVVEAYDLFGAAAPPTHQRRSTISDRGKYCIT